MTDARTVAPLGRDAVEPIGEPLVEVRDLEVTYRSRGRGVVRAVDQVSLSIAPGRTLGLVGESGSGKSTIGSVILGLVPPTAGTVRVHGRPVDLRGRSARAEHARRVQVVFQDPYGSMDPTRTVGDTLRETLRYNLRLPAAEADRRVADVLTEVGMPLDVLDRHPGDFSGGQLQRLAIARALVVDPEFIICDEAVSSLDLSVQAQVVNLLERLAHDRGLAYLFISHDLSVVRHVADEIAVLFAGQVVEQGPADMVANSPAHPYTQALVLAAPVPDPVAQRARGVLRRANRRSMAGSAHDALGCPFAARCPFAVEVCRVQRPPLLPRASGARVACHRYDELAGSGPAPSAVLDEVVQRHVDGAPGIDVLSAGAADGRRLLLDQLDRSFERSGRPVPAVATEGDLDVAVPAAGSLRPDAATDRSVRVRLYHPQAGRVLPVHVLLHGGAWISGSGDEQFTIASARHRARGARCAVATVEYALAPEDPWPAALDDVRAAVAYLTAHAAELGLRPGVFSIGGVSAGANLAVAATLAGLATRPCGLVLEVPALDLTAGTVRRHEPGADVGELLRPVAAYLDGRVDATDPLVSPLLAPSLAQLPPTWIFDAGADPLRHDAEHFRDRLLGEGVEVHHVRTEGALHGSMLLTGSWEPAWAWQEAATAAVQAVHRGAEAVR